MGNLRKHEDNDLEVSLSIELDDADLLDIDGSDDATVMFAKRAKRARANKRLAAPQQQVVHVVPADERRTRIADDMRATNPIERQAEIYPDAPTLIEPSIVLSSSLTMKAAAKTVRKSQAPAHFWRPRERKVSESYPPVAVMTGAEADLNLGGGRSSRWVWTVAAVIGTLLLIAGSLRSVPHADASANAAQPPPAAEEAPLTSERAEDTAKVVKFADDDAIAIKRAPKPAAAPVRHWTPPTTWGKKIEKPVVTKADKADKPAAEPAAHKKTAEEKELEELQARAMAR